MNRTRIEMCIRDSKIGVAFDRYVIVVVNPAQVAEHQMASERGCFAGDALHHIAVAAHRVNVIIEQREVRPIEMLRQPALRDRHANACRTALAERPRCRLDARGDMI